MVMERASVPMAESRELRVPFGVDPDGNLVAAGGAVRETPYSCPACSSSLVLRQGDVRVTHFAHLTDVACSAESVMHKTAKLRIQQAITEWKEGRAAVPRVQRKCPRCRGFFRTPLPDRISAAELEHRLPSGLVADVALLSSGQLAGIVEIRWTHSVPNDKADALESAGVRWVELDADRVVADPLTWRPIRASKAAECDDCRELLRRLSEEAGLDGPPRPPYEAQACSCWRCKREILVITWRGHRLFPTTRPPDPVPRTIQYRSSKTVGSKYWGNICPHCDVLQGDFPLYEEPDGPFFGRGAGEETQRSGMSIREVAEIMSGMRNFPW